MRKDNRARETIKINKLVEDFCKKYDTLITFIPPAEIELMFGQVLDELPDVVDFNPEFQVNFLVERKFFLKARDEINDGNIDLEILIVDKYLSIAKFLLRQLKYKGEDADNIAEEGIMNCIENYDGQDGFKNAVLKTLKKIIRAKQEPPKVKEELLPTIEVVEQSPSVQSEEVKKDSTPTEPIITFNEVQEELPKVEEANEPKQELVIPNDGIIRMPNQLELLMRSIDILHQVPIDDDTYLKFISLKYGYHQNQYFGLDEIANILSISIEQSKNYYYQSLEYVKNWFGLQLDKMYTYYIQKSE